MSGITGQLVAIAVLVAVGLVWMVLNLKTTRTSPLKTVSLLLAWAFLLGASLAALRLAWGLLS